VNLNRLGSGIPNIQFMSYLCVNTGIRDEVGASVQTRKKGTEINKRIMQRTPKKLLMFCGILKVLLSSNETSVYSYVKWFACWPLVPKFAGSNPAEAVGFFWRKNPHYAFLRRGSKAVCPMSQLCGVLKNPANTWKSDCLAKLDRPILAHNSSFR
jgi:hypothetical protein